MLRYFRLGIVVISGGMVPEKIFSPVFMWSIMLSMGSTISFRSYYPMLNQQ